MANAEKPRITRTNGSNTLHVPELRRRDSDDSDESDDLEVYFVGPRDLSHHSRWPIFLQLHGSVTPLMVLPLLFVGGWATAITCISFFVHDLGINQLLLTVLGFVVGMALSFRSSTAYERYTEGRKYWAQLLLATQSLARLIWIHAEEREEFEKEDLLGKLTFCNMLVAFAFAPKQITAEKQDRKPPSRWKVVGMMLGLPMAESNPRKLVRNSKKPLGNLPLEILDHCSAFVKTIIDNGTFKAPIYQTQAMTLLTQMNDILTGTDRVLNTPLPIAYSIAIAQITWVYILLLPFQLFNSLGWVTIPASMFAAYIILGIALIGREIENPFGDDVNDLPLDIFCEQIRQDIDVIICRAPPTTEDFVKRDENALLYPLSNQGYSSLQSKTVEEIRELLRAKPDLTFKKEEENTLVPGERLSRLLSGSSSRPSGSSRSPRIQPTISKTVASDAAV
ncbi:UPF0187-domain-containing protein [Zopfia rhizophila CBS 207.26]|uniref:UPF0187-domain-containing protein n=1 Tax=Zopfia rhizophila CBS 207.26 TaxID=1314779 RepID=A0A6A6D995_9PEZI|nr:UPF0187-domain-containing protein [Zopfia rhizophila CBS 207.26]